MAYSLTPPSSSVLLAVLTPPHLSTISPIPHASANSSISLISPRFYPLPPYHPYNQRALFRFFGSFNLLHFCHLTRVTVLTHSTTHPTSAVSFMSFSLTPFHPRSSFHPVHIITLSLISTAALMSATPQPLPSFTTLE